MHYFNHSPLFCSLVCPTLASVKEDEVEDKVANEGAVDGSDGVVVCVEIEEEGVDEEGAVDGSNGVVCEGVDEEGIKGCSGVDVVAISAGTVTFKNLLQLLLSLQHL